jgi:dTDP-glucose 4,6-dehydratase
LHAAALAAGLSPLVLPPVQQLIGTGTVSEFARLTDEQMMNRQPVRIDLDAIRATVSGRVVMITGAGGSIGSELSRQTAACSPRSLVLVDHDDSLLHSVTTDLVGGDVVVHAELADVRDRQRMFDVVGTHLPSLVIHAAALKHLPALEAHPDEGWKTNVVGTANVLAAAEQHGVERFVNISTDKAADPVNVLGRTKRVAERLVAGSAVRTGHRYVSVRFGNVIGSRGSVVETFERQIAAGGPVTVTHPDVTRFFMTIREAVRLTLQATVVGDPGEVLILDMGQPVRIADVARQLIEQSGSQVEIVFVGLRPGEKLHEVLVGEGEQPVRRCHPLIDHAPVPALASLDGCSDADDLVRLATHVS